jgi:hypothetical protein
MRYVEHAPTFRLLAGRSSKAHTQAAVPVRIRAQLATNSDSAALNDEDLSRKSA